MSGGPRGAAGPDPRCGRTWRVHVGGCVVTAFALPAGFAAEPHAHARGGVALPLEGGVEIGAADTGAGAALAAAGASALPLPAGWRHRERSGRGARVLLVEPSPEAPGWEGSVLDAARLLESPGAAAAARRLARSVSGGLSRGLDPDPAGGPVGPPGESAGPGPGAEADLAELGLHLAVAAGAVPRPGGRGAPPWLARVTERLRDEWRDPPGLGALADDAGVSPAHLARTFRRGTGLTLGGWLRRLRAAEAADRLRSGRAPLSAVAQACGYADQSHMGRHLRRYLGTTPAALRSRARP